MIRKMQFTTVCVFSLVVSYLSLPIATFGQAKDQGTDGWSHESARPEIAPEFSHVKSGTGELTLKLSGRGRETVDGAWTKIFEVQGGRLVRFKALKRTQHIASPTRSALVKIIWQDSKGRLVNAAKVHGNMVLGNNEVARPEYPSDQRSDTNSGKNADDEWIEVSDSYRVPSDATQARVELRLRWTKRHSGMEEDRI